MKKKKLLPDKVSKKKKLLPDKVSFSPFIKSKKGQAETPFILSLMVIIAVIVALTALIAMTMPDFKIINTFDMVYFSGSIVGVAGACAIATGLACAGALGIFVVLSLFVTSNPIISALLLAPLTVTVAYIVSRLARGGG